MKGQPVLIGEIPQSDFPQTDVLNPSTGHYRVISPHADLSAGLNWTLPSLSKMSTPEEC